MTIKLNTINKVLKLFNLILIICVDEYHKSPTKFMIITYERFKKEICK